MGSLRVMAKAMRAAKAMKAMKRVSKFAKGKLAKLVVFRGNKEATTGGLTKSSLTKNKNGKIVSKKTREREEVLLFHQGLDPRRDEGAQGSRREGIPRCEEGHAPVQEGEGVLRALSAILGDARSSGMWGSPA